MAATVLTVLSNMMMLNQLRELLLPISPEAKKKKMLNCITSNEEQLSSYGIVD